MRIMINLINIEIFLQMTPLNYNLFKIQRVFFQLNSLLTYFAKKRKKRKKKKNILL